MSPRAALIYQPTEKWSYKFLFGRSFRNPSSFQLFYSDGFSAIANPALRPESADTVEVDVERKLGRHLNLVVAGYSYWLNNFLESVLTDSGLYQVQNHGKVHADGVEIELNGRPFPWLEATASYAFQKSNDYDGDGILENSPEHLAKFRLAVPLGRKFGASSSMQYYSKRLTLAGAYVTPVYLADLPSPRRSCFPPSTSSSASATPSTEAIQTP